MAHEEWRPTRPVPTAITRRTFACWARSPAAAAAAAAAAADEAENDAENDDALATHAAVVGGGAPRFAAHCEQMIMGGGKTTVIAPLLALLLADGRSLVVQCVPHALLEMSRAVMRERFSALVRRPVTHTRPFDAHVAVTL